MAEHELSTQSVFAPLTGEDVHMLLNSPGENLIKRSVFQSIAIKLRRLFEILSSEIQALLHLSRKMSVDLEELLDTAKETQFANTTQFEVAQNNNLDAVREAEAILKEYEVLQKQLTFETEPEALAHKTALYVQAITDKAKLSNQKIIKKIEAVDLTERAKQLEKPSEKDKITYRPEDVRTCVSELTDKKQHLMSHLAEHHQAIADKKPHPTQMKQWESRIDQQETLQAESKQVPECLKRLDREMQLQRILLMQNVLLRDMAVVRVLHEMFPENRKMQMIAYKLFKPELTNLFKEFKKDMVDEQQSLFKGVQALMDQLSEIQQKAQSLQSKIVKLETELPGLRAVVEERAPQAHHGVTPFRTTPRPVKGSNKDES